MQTSGKSSISSRPVSDWTTKVAGLGLASAAFIVFAIGTGTSCSPGGIDNPDQFITGAGGSGTGGAGAAPGGAGGGGAGGAGGSPPASAAPEACGRLNIATLADVETKFIAPRCGMGTGSCHASLFAPKGLDKPDMVSMLLVDRKGSVYCMQDAYIAKGNPSKSYVLAKIMATDKVTCPSGGDGGAKMPFTGALALSNDERDCFVWYINERAK
jgi:hypothetical protein